jgi:hypothetical protein
MVLPILFRKLRGLCPTSSQRIRDDLHFVMYTRQGCHLCDSAWQQLQEAQKLHGFRLDKEDVDADPELALRHGKCVPVVAVNGKVRFRGAINPVLLKRLLR